LVTALSFASDARVETWIERGAEVSSHYDPLLAKLIVRGEVRDDALTRLASTLDATSVAGLETNLAFLRAIAAAPFLSGRRNDNSQP
jgi:urea carboxylase